jgi:hypothetical protein
MKNIFNDKTTLAALFALLFIAGCSFRDMTLDGTAKPPVDWGTAIIPKITFVDPAPGISIQTPYTMKISITDDGIITSAYIVFVGQTNTLNYNTTNGYYQYNIQSMPNGLHSAIVAAIDDDGNKAVNAMTVIVANPAGTPSILWTKPLPNAWITSGIVNGTYFVNNGTLLASNAVSVLTNGVLAGYAAYAAGNWSYNLNVSTLPDSTALPLTVIASAKGGKTATNTLSVSIDNSLPTASLSQPTDYQSVPNTGFTIAGNSSDAPSGISSTVVSIPGIWQTNLGAGAFSFAFPGVIYGGTNLLIVKATDKAGLVKSVTNRIVAVYMPQTTLTNPAADTVITSASVIFAGKASVTGGGNLTGLTVKASNSVMITSNKSLSGTSVNWTQAVNISSLAEGAFYVKAYALTASTNNSALASWVRFYKDMSAPTNYINTATVTTNAKNILFGIGGYSYDGGSGIDRVLVVVSNYNGVTTNTVYGFGANTLNWNKEVFVRLGTNSIRVSTVDKAGKVSSVMQKKVICSRAITIDGANDFDAITEKFSTTSSATGYYTYVTWNANSIYLGFEGGDVGADDVKKWILIYISTNTNDASGNKKGVGYNTQTPYLPFKAQYHLGLQLVNTGGIINESYGAGWAQSGWYTQAGNLYRTGSYYEVRIPLSDIGNRSKYYITTLMIIELAGGEHTYAKLYSDNLADGYDTHLTKFIEVSIPDITTPPNSAGFKKSGDLIPPTVSIDSPANGSSTTNVNITLSGTAADTGSSVQSVYVKLDGGAYKKAAGTAGWSTNLTGLTAGAHTNRAYAVDAYGNSSATNMSVFTVVAGYNTYHTLTIDGTIDYYKSSEFLGEGGAGIGAAVTWDATYLYIVISNKNFAGDTVARLNFYLSTNTNFGTAYCFDYDGASGARAHPHNIKMQYNIEVYHNGSSGYAKLFRDNGAGWWNFTDLGVSDAYISWDTSHTTSEVKIAWSKFNLSEGKPFWIYGFIANGGNDYVYSTWPTINTKGEDAVDTSADKYYQFTIASGVTPNSAGNIKP